MLQTLIEEYQKQYDETFDERQKLRARLKEIEDPLKTLEKGIKKATIALGRSQKILRVVCTFRTGYTKDKWDGDGLQKHAINHPKILEFRSFTNVSPACSVKIEPLDDF